MFSYWKKINTLNVANKAYLICASLLFASNIFLIAKIASAPNKITVYLPPDVSAGATLRPNKIPSSTIYAFAFQIFSIINSWPTSGQVDYKANIDKYGPYLSPEMKKNLLQDLSFRKNNESLDRVRTMSLYRPFMDGDVKALSSDSWLVNINFRIVETVNNQVVKDVIMRYPLLIGRFRSPLDINPWQLRIEAIDGSIHRIKTNV